MLGLKVKNLTSIEVPSELLTDVVMEKKLDELDDSNILDTAKELCSVFITPASVTTLAGYIELWANIRPLNMELYAQLAYELIQQNIDPIFKKALLDKAEFSFLRFCYLEHVFTMDDIKKKIDADQNQAFFFVPELGITKGARDFNDIIDDQELLPMLQENDWAMFRDLIEYGYTANTVEYAIKYDDLDLMLKLWKGDDYYVDMKIYENSWDALEWRSYNSLSFAARYGAINCFRNLLKRGARPDENLCENAVIGGNKEIIEAAAAMQGDFNECLKPAAMFHRYDVFDWIIANYETEKLEISYPCAYANWLAFLFCAANDSDIRSTNNDFTSALHWAAYWGIPYVMEICLSDQRANLNFIDGNKMTPLLWAAIEGNTEMVQMLLDKGASLNADTVSTPLVEAVRNGHYELAQYLIDIGADVLDTDKNGFSVLHTVCFYGDAKLAQMLIASGASLEDVSDDGQTPLHTAAAHGCLDICKLYIKKGCDVNALDKNGETPLFYAIRHNHHKIVKLLIVNGANIAVKNDKANQPIHIACKIGNVDTIKYLISKGANIRAPGYDERQPINYAANDEITQLLLDSGAAEHEKKITYLSTGFFVKLVCACLGIIIAITLSHIR